MKKFTFINDVFLFAILISIVGTNLAVASHVSGGEITYTSLGGNQYKVVFINYWDCSTFDPGNVQSLTASNTCGLSNVPFTVNLDSAAEISQVCPSELTTCSGGSLPGNKKNVYSAIVTLPGGCNQWVFEHTSCCRSTAINVTTQPSYTFYALLNNVDAPANNSPYFTSQPLPYVCIGQPVNYSPGVVEQDGNTLSYSLVSAMDGNYTTPVVYAGGFSGTSPIAGITIDSITGLIQFTPVAIGNFVVVYLVTEKDTNGIVVGKVIRDLQMVVVSCTNQVIPGNSGGITNLVGNGATLTGPNTMQICENIPFSFQASFTDPDAANVLSYTSNIAQILPGSVVTSSGVNPIVITVSWNAPSGSSGLNTSFVLTVFDDACPVMGQQTVNYTIDVLPATFAGPNATTCGNQSVQLHGAGPGTVFSWSVISGPPMIIGANFSCNPCQNPFTSPASTTTYLLTCSGGLGCLLTDTITVNVVPDFSYGLTQSSSGSCLLQPIQLGINNLNPAGSGYSYQWSPSTYLNNNAIANPIATIMSPGAFTYISTVTSTTGCIKKDTLTVTIIPSVSPDPTLTTSDSSACPGQTIQLGATFGNGIPAICDLSTSGGCAATIPVTLGMGALTTNAYPTPFTGYWDNGRIQMLYRASELYALGFVGGKISSIALDVAQKASTQPYSGFTIKMGCTNIDSIANTSFQAVSRIVYGPVSESTLVGWNTFSFPTPYEWDGISNLIIEMCYSNATWTGNDVLNKTATAFFSVVNDYEDTNPGCGLPFPDTFISQFERPNTRFEYCGTITDSTNFIYSWFPAGGVASPSSQNTNAVISGATVYTVVVTDTVTGCSASDSILIDLCLGIDESQTSGISVFPSPASEVIKISNPSFLPLSYELFDITGKLIIGKMQSAKSIIEINTASLEPGVYILLVKQHNERKSFRVIIH